MRKQSSNIDGFIPRRTGRTVGDARKTSLGVFTQKPTESKKIPELSQSRKSFSASLPQVENRTVSRREIDESLNGIDNESEQPKRRRGFFRRKAVQTPNHRKKIIKRIMIVLGLLLLLVGIYLGYSFLKNSTSVLSGNVFDIFQNKPLKKDEHGRTNILIYGTSGSFEDQRHEGASLTDTLMVLSVDQEKKNAFMFNLPRDFYVNYDTTSCSVGYQGKINAMHFCYTGGATDKDSDNKGAKALQKKFKEITGLSFQYYAHINWAVVAGAVNAVGGVDVDVKGNGSCALWGMPEGSVVDNNMKIRYKPGSHRMNGEEALKFSRARGASGACGLDDGDYDRQKNQQKVLQALQKKAVSAGTVTNIGKVTGLMDALGQNLRTDFEMSEVRTLLSLAGDISPSKIKSIDLRDQKENLLTSNNTTSAGSIQIPVAGMYDYSQIQSYLNKILNATDLTREEAQIALLNASGVEGYAGMQAAQLKKHSLMVASVGNAPDGTYNAVEVFDLTGGKKPATGKKLASIYDVEVNESKPAFAVAADADFVVVFGKATSAN